MSSDSEDVKTGKVMVSYREPESGSSASGTEVVINLDLETRSRSGSIDCSSVISGMPDKYLSNSNSPNSTPIPNSTKFINEEGPLSMKGVLESKNDAIPTTNTIVASNGEIYHVEPFMMPPPSEIAALFKERRDRAESNMSEGHEATDRQIKSLEQSPHVTIKPQDAKYSTDVYTSKLKYVGYTQGKSDMFSLRDFTQSFSTSKGNRPRADSNDYNDKRGGYGESGIPLPPPIRTSGMSSAARTLTATTRNVAISPNGMKPMATGDIQYAPDGVFTERDGVVKGTGQFEGGREVAFMNEGGKVPTPLSGSNGSSSQGSPLHGGRNDSGTEAPQVFPQEGLIRRNGRGSGDEETATLPGVGGLEGRVFDIRGSRRDREDSVADDDWKPLDGLDERGHREALGRAQQYESYYHHSKFNPVRFLLSEMFGIGQPSTGEKQGTENIQNFLKVPLLLESLIGFGFLMCFDSFLYPFTYLPLRCIYAVYLLASDLLSAVLPASVKPYFEATLVLSPRRGSSGAVHGERESRPHFTTSHAYDLMRGGIIVLAVIILQNLNMSRVYHYIRGQTMIKLYVLTSMLEILDKLLSSFGQDAFDSLNWRSRTFRLNCFDDYWQTLFSFIVLGTYVVCHSTIYFIHVATLTVAINSNEQALITVLILNNFAEIKGFVFKKFDKTNLFQLACSDITERFQLVLFLSTILVVSCVQAGPDWVQAVRDHLFVIFLMYSGECLSDWIKHAFISKFNHIDASVYDDFSRVLRKDILGYQKVKEKGSVLDRTYAITRRVGLSQIPLVVVTIRYLNLAWLSPQFQYWFYSLSASTRVLGCCAIFLSLVLFKMAFSVGIFVLCGTIHNKELVAREVKALTTGVKRLSNKKSASALSNIERYTMIKGHVIA